MIRKRKVGEAIEITFMLPANHPCSPVSVVGDFNHWQPLRNPLIRRPDGSASTSVLVPPGTRLTFRYLGAEGAWFDDPDADDHVSDACVVIA